MQLEQYQQLWFTHFGGSWIPVVALDYLHADDVLVSNKDGCPFLAPRSHLSTTPDWSGVLV